MLKGKAVKREIERIEKWNKERVEREREKRGTRHRCKGRREGGDSIWYVWTLKREVVEGEEEGEEQGKGWRGTERGRRVVCGHTKSRAVTTAAGG